MVITNVTAVLQGIYPFVNQILIIRFSTPAAQHLRRLHGAIREVEPSRLFVGRRLGHLALPESTGKHQCGGGHLSELEECRLNYY